MKINGSLAPLAILLVGTPMCGSKTVGPDGDSG